MAGFLENMKEQQPDQEYSQYLAHIRQETRKFKNVISKIRNPHLSHLVAWEEAQEPLQYFVKDYPANYQATEEAIRKVFEVRRKAFLRQIDEKTVSAELRSITDHLTDNEWDLCEKPFTLIRDLIFHQEGYTKR